MIHLLTGIDGMMKFVHTEDFRKLNAGFALDEGQTYLNMLLLSQSLTQRLHLTTFVLESIEFKLN